MIVLAVDPGTRKTGIAVVGPSWCLVSVVHGDAAPGRALDLAGQLVGGDQVDHAVIEVPVYRSHDRSLGSPNDLITLALLAGRIAGAVGTVFPGIELVPPHTWKGVIPKDVHQARTRRRIEAHHPGWLPTWDRTDHNGRDAIALAMWRGGLLA